MTTAIPRTKWFLPSVSVALGLIIFGALWIGDDRAGAFWAFGLMAAVAIGLLAGGRFDLIRGIRGDGRDEYWQRIDIHATVLAGNFLIGLIIAMCAWEWAHGRDGTPYVQLGALTGVAYVAAFGILRWRS